MYTVREPQKKRKKQCNLFANREKNEIMWNAQLKTEKEEKDLKKEQRTNVIENS